jgi:hypothetical protein
MLLGEPRRATIPTRTNRSLPGLAKHSITIPTPRGASMLLGEPRRATIPIRSSGSLSAGTSRPHSSVGFMSTRPKKRPAYWPKTAVIDGSWMPPAVQRVEGTVGRQ